jgi:putative ABC transport system permease protein
MFSNYLKTAWRNLLKNRGFAITNLLSLTIGISSTILILLWVQSELSWNRDQQHYETTYQVFAHRDFNGNKVTDNSIVLPLADAIKQELPQVPYASFTSYSENHILTVGDKKLKKSGLRVSPDYFKIFTYRFLEGSMQQALIAPDAIIIAASTARALFGTTAVLNSIIRFDNQTDVRVTAVVEDPDPASSQQFDFITPYSYREAAMQDWTNSYSNLYLRTTTSAGETALNTAINKLVNSRSNNKISTYFVHPMKKWRLYSEFRDGKNVGGMITYVRMFSIIAFVILLIACINFMNLSTARSEKRAREVGIRKTLGSGKKELMLQFFSESVILAFVAFLLSVLAVSLILPAFNKLIDRELVLRLYSAKFWLVAAVIILFTGLVAGSYPAVYLSSFSPVRVLKGSFLPGKAAIGPRRMLVVVQFVISILLISATVRLFSSRSGT